VFTALTLFRVRGTHPNFSDTPQHTKFRARYHLMLGLGRLRCTPPPDAYVEQPRPCIQTLSLLVHGFPSNLSPFLSLPHSLGCTIHTGEGMLTGELCAWKCLGRRTTEEDLAISNLGSGARWWHGPPLVATRGDAGGHEWQGSLERSRARAPAPRDSGSQRSPETQSIAPHEQG
jgi:hypothetical protein